MRVALVPAAIAFLCSCTTAPPPTGCPLRLEIDGALPSFTAGAHATLPFVVRNVAAQRVKACVIDGLSVHLRSDTDGPWRLILSTGSTTDVECSHPLRLAAGQTDSFAQDIPIFSNLPPLPTTLRARLYFEDPAFNGQCGNFLEWQEAITILSPP